jgi:hypothetical protein
VHFLLPLDPPPKNKKSKEKKKVGNTHLDALEQLLRPVDAVDGELVEELDWIEG